MNYPHSSTKMYGASSSTKMKETKINHRKRISDTQPNVEKMSMHRDNSKDEKIKPNKKEEIK